MRDTPSAGRKNTPHRPSRARSPTSTRGVIDPDDTVAGHGRGYLTVAVGTGDMDRTFIAGAGLTVAGVCGYVVGVLVTYPGRAFSLTAIMIGITLASIGEGRGAGA